MSVSLTPAERAEVARQLHEEVAQTIAALAYQISAAARDCPDAATVARLAELRALAGDALEQTRTLARAVQPAPAQLAPHGDPLRALLVPAVD